MPQPPVYNRAFNFSDHQAHSPASPLPGPQVDAELNRIKQTTDATLANLAMLQRDDGALMNGTVGVDQLHPSLSIGFEPRGNWAEGVDYMTGDGVAFDDKFYRASRAHTSTPENRPGVGEMWVFFFSITNATFPPGSIDASVILADSSVTNAKMGVGSVDTPNYADGSVTGIKLAEAGVDNSKLAAMAEGTVKGRAAGAGAPEDLTGAQVLAIAQAVGYGSAQGLDTAQQAQARANVGAPSVWEARAGIGGWYYADTSKAGVELPPLGTGGPTVWVELTAGLTGAGQFNAGKLTGESVSGSAPLVLATAVVSLAGSPMNGQTIDLLNTEGRILRPSTSPGSKQNDALQNITGRLGPYHRETIDAQTGALFADGSLQSALGGTTNRNFGYIGLDASKVARTDVETRMKNIAVKAYMRIK